MTFSKLGLIFLILISISPRTHAFSALDTNDISILFPIRSGRPWPAINPEKEGLLSSELREQMLRFENPHAALTDLPFLDTDIVTDPDRWWVTGFRLDPCGEVFDVRPAKDQANQTDILIARRAPGCQGRLRLVMQPFNRFGTPIVSAIHLLYKLEPSEVRLVAESLAALKAVTESAGVITTGRPLAIHPGLENEASTSGMPKTDVAVAVAKTIRDALHLNSKTPLERLEIATLNIEIAIDRWKLVGGYVNAGTWTRFVTEFSKQMNDGRDATILTGVENLNCDRFSVCFLLPSPSKQPSVLSPSGTVVTNIFQDVQALRDQQTVGFRSSEIQAAAEVVDDPSQTHFFNTNCMSCHESSNLRNYAGLSSKFGSADGVTPFVPKKYLKTLTTGIINFGYFGATPRISTRTAADSVVAADAINRSFGVANPAAPISDFSKLWTCLVSETDIKKCF